MSIDRATKMRGAANKIAFGLLLAIPIVTCILFGGVDSGTWVLISAAAGVFALLLAIDSFRSQGISIYRSYLPIPLLFWILLGVLQIAGGYSLDPYATRMFAIRLLVYLLFFCGALSLLDTTQRTVATARIVVGFAAVLALYSILQRLAAPGTIFGLRETPDAVPFGPFVNQHHFASFMVLTCGLAAAAVFGKKRREETIFWLIALLIMGTAVVLTSSRGGMLGLIVAVGIAFAMSHASGRGRRSRARYKGLVKAFAAALAFGIVAIGIALTLNGGDSLTRYAGGGGLSADISNGRMHFWGISLRIFADHPIIGAGLDAFGVAFTKYDTWDGTFRIENAHNDYLQTLADTGIAGFLALIAFVVIFVRSSRKAIGCVSVSSRPVLIGAFSGCVGVMVHSFFDFPLRTPSNAIFFLLVAALAVIVPRNDEASEQ